MPRRIKTLEKQPDEKVEEISQGEPTCYVCRKIVRLGEQVYRMVKSHRTTKMVRHTTCGRRVEIREEEQADA